MVLCLFIDCYHHGNEDDINLVYNTMPRIPNLNIFLDLTFKCQGYIKEWHLISNKKGTFYAGVWEKNATDETNVWKLRLVGFNEIHIKDIGFGVSTNNY